MASSASGLSCLVLSFCLLTNYFDIEYKEGIKMHDLFEKWIEDENI